jgi:hypothetical protein
MSGGGGRGLHGQLPAPRQALFDKLLALLAWCSLSVLILLATMPSGGVLGGHLLLALLCLRICWLRFQRGTEHDVF